MTVVVLAAASCSAEPSRSGPSVSQTSPAPTASPTPTSTPALTPEVVGPRITAEDVVGDPDAHLSALEVSSSDPDVRMADWYVCVVPSCQQQRHALVVTDDGFATRHVVDLPVRRHGHPMVSLGGRTFLLQGVRREGLLVQADGTTLDVLPSRGPASPVAEGELVVRSFLGGEVVGIDPGTGRSHRVPTPPGPVQLDSGPGDRLRLITMEEDGWGYHVSEDGGATWQGGSLPGVRRGHELVSIVPTGDPDVHVVSVIPDGATVQLWDRTLRSDDGGRTWTAYEGVEDPRAVIWGEAVLPDGRLVLDVDGWSDDRARKPSQHPTGLSASADWTVFRTPRRQSRDVRLLDIVVTTKRVWIWAAGWKDVTFDRVRRTDDGGLTWQIERAG
jgi:hypothetical protein